MAKRIFALCLVVMVFGLLSVHSVLAIEPDDIRAQIMALEMAVAEGKVAGNQVPTVMNQLHQLRQQLWDLERPPCMGPDEPYGFFEILGSLPQSVVLGATDVPVYSFGLKFNTLIDIEAIDLVVRSDKPWAIQNLALYSSGAKVSSTHVVLSQQGQERFQVIPKLTTISSRFELRLDTTSYVHPDCAGKVSISWVGVKAKTLLTGDREILITPLTATLRQIDIAGEELKISLSPYNSTYSNSIAYNVDVVGESNRYIKWSSAKIRIEVKGATNSISPVMSVYAFDWVDMFKPLGEGLVNSAGRTTVYFNPAWLLGAEDTCDKLILRLNIQTGFNGILGVKFEHIEAYSRFGDELLGIEMPKEAILFVGNGMPQAQPGQPSSKNERDKKDIEIACWAWQEGASVAVQGQNYFLEAKGGFGPYYWTCLEAWSSVGGGVYVWEISPLQFASTRSVKLCIIETGWQELPQPCYTTVRVEDSRGNRASLDIMLLTEAASAAPAKKNFSPSMKYVSSWGAIKK